MVCHVKLLGSSIGWLFSSLRLWRIMDVKYCITMVFMFVNVALIVDSVYLYVSWSVFIEGMCAIPRAPTVITISGATFQPRF